MRRARSADCRLAAEIGRRARLELVFASRRGRTVLAHAYAEPPWRVGRLLEGGSIAQLILVCSGPGVFAGDRLQQRVLVERGARVLLVSQAALQVHPGHAASPAQLDSSYHVEHDGSLDCVWDAVIPFAGSRLRQRTDLQVAEGGQLFWSDALMAGRVGRAEAWLFAALDHELRASVGGSLQYLERYVLTPPSSDPGHPWRAAQANYVGTTIVHSAEAVAHRAGQAQERLATIDGLRAGVDCPAPNLLVARLLAAHGPQFAAARGVLRDVFARPAFRRAW
jgi:urease accessory protein UreH